MSNKEILTVSEFAAAAGITKQAVYSSLKSRLQPYIVKDEKGRICLKSAALEQFYNKQVSSQVESSFKQVSSQVESSLTDRLFEALQEELKQKDIELNKREEQIKELQDKLDNAYNQISELAKQAHYITAADKTVTLIEEKQQKPEKGKKWYQFWKK